MQLIFNIFQPYGISVKIRLVLDEEYAQKLLEEFKKEQADEENEDEEKGGEEKGDEEKEDEVKEDEVKEDDEEETEFTGEINHEFPLKVTVLSTDYEKYALIHTCSENEGDEGKLFVGNETIIVWTMIINLLPIPGKPTIENLHT